MQRFNTAQYELTQDALTFRQQLTRWVSIGLPEATEVTIKRFVRNWFIQPMAKALTEKRKLATPYGADAIATLLRIA